jgi:glyceraldehyde-3-phosphate dehydrogenase/erythrose-4-phosphate dehydrogenase
MAIDLIVNGDRIKVCAERDPAKLPWGGSASTWCSNAPACSPRRPRPAHI